MARPFQSQSPAWVKRYQERITMRLRRLKIGTRLTMGLGFLTLVMTVLIILGISSMRFIDNQMENIVEISNKKIWHAYMILDAIHILDKSTLTIISAKDEMMKSFESVKMLTAQASYKSALQELNKLEQTAKGKELLLNLMNSLDTARTYNDFTLEMALNGKPDQALAFYMGTERPSALNLQKIITELVTYEKEQSDLHYREAVNIYATTRNVFLIIGALALLIGVFMAFLLTRSITKPLAEGVHIANRLAEGDFTVSIEGNADNETGQLLSALKNMAEKLKQVKSLEQQLQQSQKLEQIGRLAGGIAHDFNNLLTVITGFSDLALMKIKGESPLKSHIVQIQKASERAGNLTRQLLAFSRRQIMEMKIADLNILLLDLEKMLRRVISEDIELKFLMAEDLGKVRIDPGQIEQAILNLVLNAKDAMPSGGHLTIETSNVELEGAYCRTHVGATPGPHVLLAVSDTGTGMPPETRDRVFEPFFTTKEKGKGTGLGLAMVYGIVKQSGGHIWVYSEVDHGATFKIYLPRVNAKADPVPHQDEEASLPRGDETIFLVEDEHSVRHLAALALREQGYNVLEAKDGIEALRMIGEEGVNRIDLMLTDVVMPRMGGKELIDKLKSLRPEIRVLFTSGYTENAIVHQGVLDAGIDFLPKPFTSISLARKVREVLNK